MLAALGYGLLAASSLVLGAGLALVRPWPARAVGLVLAFGAGALISAVSFELAGEGLAVGSPGAVAGGLAAGALAFFFLDGLVSGGGRGRPGRKQSEDPGNSLALGALLDGIPEQLVLGLGLAGGEGVGVGLLVAIYVSNLPEGIGSAADMRKAGRSRGSVLWLWLRVALVCTAATLAGYGLGDMTSGEFRAVIDGFAAGALLVMLVDSMVPEARKDGGRTAGLATVLGFALATGLSALS
ncbi:MAG TPA: ZIP family metal transporter [Thermoleophilaceae bacterium]|nr:ZIP family metal transporter [Thermoleophilaceae bacterium]